MTWKGREAGQEEEEVKRASMRSHKVSPPGSVFCLFLSIVILYIFFLLSLYILFSWLMSRCRFDLLTSHSLLCFHRSGACCWMGHMHLWFCCHFFLSSSFWLLIYKFLCSDHS